MQIKTVFFFFFLIATQSIAFTQLTAPNKTDKNGLRTGKWIFFYDVDNNLLKDAVNADWYNTAKFKKNIPVGFVNEYSIENNNLVYSAQYKSMFPDTLNGIAILYYKNNNKKYIYNYQDGLMQGLAEQFYPSGNIQWRCNYTDDLPDGNYTEYYENGNVMRSGSVTLGKKNGVFNFYRSTGVIEKSTTYENDLRIGITKNYDSSGLLTSVFPYENDMLTGVIKYYNTTGEVGKCVMYYQDAILDLYDLIGSTAMMIALGDASEEAFTKGFIMEEYFRYTYGEENVLYGFATGFLSQLYFLNGDKENGLPWTLKTYAIDKKAIGTKDEPTADGWHLFSLIFSTYGEYDLALEASQKAIDRSRLHGEPTATTLEYLNRMAGLQITIDNYDEGFAVYDTILNICDNMPDSMMYDCTNYGLEYASYLNATFNSEQALATLNRVEKMAAGTGLDYNVLYAKGKSKIDLNRVEDGLADYKIVYDNFRIAQSDTVLHLDVVRDLANYYTGTGNYSAAEKLYLESIAVSKNYLQSDSSDYFNRMMDIADFYVRVGRYQQAIPLAEDVTMFRTRELQNNTNTFFDFLTGDLLKSNFNAQLMAMGRIYESANKMESAEIYYRQAFDFALAEEGDSSFNYINATAALAGVAMDQEKYLESEELYASALALSEKYLGDLNINYQTWRDNVSELYIRMERYDDALAIAEEVLDYRKNNYNETDPLVLASYRRLASIYDALNKPELARDLYVRNLDLQLEQLNTNFSVMNAAEQEAFLSTFRYQFDVFNDFVFAHSQLPGIAGDMYNYQLANRAMLLYSSTNARRNFEQSPDAEIRNVYTEWLHTKQYVAKLESQTDADKSYVDSLKIAADNYEKQLNLKSGSNISYVVNEKWTDVKKQLQATDAVIEFLQIYSYSDKQHQGEWYAAMILTGTMQEPELVMLCSEDILLQIIAKRKDETDAAYASRLYGFPEYDEEEAYYDGQHLYQLLWQPLQKYLTVNGNIYITVSGVINTINVAAIPIAFNTYAGFNYNISQIGNSADLEKIKKADTFKSGEIAMIGGVDYMSSDDKLYAAMQSENTLQNANELLVLNDSRNAVNTRGGEWNYLPGTLQEVKSIDLLLQTSKNKTEMFTGSKASEDMFKNFSGNAPEIMHISTHGFFVDQLPGNAVSNSDAMYRSGLLLAGGNRSWNGEKLPADLNDGILTAAEVSYMDLSKCRLAVLSACETGLGTVRSDEGVFGLQRAFKLAGVENIVMSLWKVSDKETALFMEYFYGNLLKGMELNSAFRLAQQTMSKRYGPYYWSAFILLQ
ncbi:MAG: CHAT domain-containing protein [Chitinophagales bacterium]|nr:CHAT domain-containing protein [Chitinophagales bacterium]